MKSPTFIAVPQDDAEFDRFIDAQWPRYELPEDFSDRCMRAISLAHEQTSRRRRWLFDFDLGAAFVHRALWLSAVTCFLLIGGIWSIIPDETPSELSDFEPSPEAALSDPDELYDDPRDAFLNGGVEASTPTKAALDTHREEIVEYLAQYGKYWGPNFGFYGVVGIARGEELLLIQGRGESGGIMFPERVYALGSFGQVLIASYVLKLAERGDVDLDQAIALHAYDDPSTSGASLDKPLPTLREIVEHRSGLPRWRDAIAANTDKKKHTWEDALRWAWRHRSAPTSDIHPNPLNYALLGKWLTAKFGRDWQEQLKEDYFESIGMTNTFVSFEQAQARALYGPAPAQIFGLMEDLSIFGVDTGDSLPGAAGGIFSSAPDLLKWSQAFLDYPRATKKNWMDRYLNEVDSNSDPLSKFSLGMVIKKQEKRLEFRYAGAVDGFQTAWAAQPNGLHVVALANTHAVDACGIVEDIRRIIAGEQPTAMPESVLVEVPAKLRRSLVGRYEKTPRPRSPDDPTARATIERGKNGLLLRWSDHPPVVIHATTDGRLGFKDPSRTTADIQMDAAGKVTGLEFHAGDRKLRLRRVGR